MELVLSAKRCLQMGAMIFTYSTDTVLILYDRVTSSILRTILTEAMLRQW